MNYFKKSIIYGVLTALIFQISVLTNLHAYPMIDGNSIEPTLLSSMSQRDIESLAFNQVIRAYGETYDEVFLSSIKHQEETGEILVKANKSARTVRLTSQILSVHGDKALVNLRFQENFSGPIKLCIYPIRDPLGEFFLWDPIKTEGNGYCTFMRDQFGRYILCDGPITKIEFGYSIYAPLHEGVVNPNLYSRFTVVFASCSASKFDFEHIVRYPASDLHYISSQPPVTRVDHAELFWSLPEIHEVTTDILFGKVECDYLKALENDYKNKKGTTEAAYAHQLWCLAKHTCDEYKRNGDKGWGNRFAKSVFTSMAANNKGNRGSDYKCKGPLESRSNLRCFYNAGNIHIENDLVPAFTNYCSQVHSKEDVNRWTDDHEKFLDDTVDACLKELDDADEIDGWDWVLHLFGSKIKDEAKTLRETTQTEVCPIKPQLVFLDDHAGNKTNVNGCIAPQVFDPITLALQNDKKNQLSVTLFPENNFVIKVGEKKKIKIAVNGKDISNETDRLKFYVSNYAKDFISISQTGEIQALTTNQVTSSSPPTIVSFEVVYGDLVGAANVAIYDCDTDGDGITDSIENRVGTNPNAIENFSGDSDFDGLSDIRELFLKTNLREFDTDKDGFSDSAEVLSLTDPKSKNCTPSNPMCLTTKIFFPFIKKR